MPITSVQGLPGVGQTYTATPKTILQNLQGTEYLDGGRIVDGTASGDWSNPSASYVLESGLILGKISSSSKYAPTVLGVTQGAAGTSSTSVSVTAAQAVEIVRRIGSSGSGTLGIVGPATSGGTIASEALTFSAVNTSTGAITVSSPSQAYATGSLIVPQDGSQTPLVVLEALYGLWVTDQYFNRQDAQAPRLLVAGHLIASAITGLTDGDISSQNYLKGQLNSSGRHFVFDNEY